MSHTDTDIEMHVREVPDPSAAPQFDAAREALADAQERFLTFAKERPVVTLVIAGAVGFLLGKLASKL